MSASLPVSVVVPTIGRPRLLKDCLASIAGCDPAADDIVVVDQSGDADVASVVEVHAAAGARLVPCAGTGYARGLNVGLRAARHDTVFVTNDDCSVDQDWIAVGWRHATKVPGAIITGQVRAAGRADSVPSVIEVPDARDFTGQVTYGVLYAGNMVLDRTAALDIGGFDERPGMAVAAEDNDFCYRWLRDGRPLRYEPDLVVWHHDWRTPEQLAQRWREYAEGQGVFYAKHLRAGDVRMLRYIARDLRNGGRAWLQAVRHGQPPWADERRALLRGIPVGVARGWRQARSR